MSMTEITELVGKNYPIMTYALSESTSGTTKQLNDLRDEKTAIESILTEIKNVNLGPAIIDKATDLGGYESIYVGDGGDTSYGSWGVSSVRNWLIDVGTSFGLSVSYLSAGTFMCDGNETASFPSASNILWLNNTEHARCTVTNSVYVTGGDITSVSVSSYFTIPTSATDILHIDTTYLSGDISDSNIIKWMDDFDFAYDHLNHPLGSTGTYGINARIAALETGMVTISANEIKQTSMDGVYREYTQWVPLSLTNLQYEDTVSFSCSGNQTSLLPINTDVLIDCGVDKQKTGVVSSVLYTPVSASDYTECTIIMNVSAYAYSPETSSTAVSAINMNFENGFDTINISGGSAISGAVYEDIVTFLCPGNLVSLCPSGTNLVCEYTDPLFTPRYFTVYSIEHKSDSNADTTVVSVSGGLQITENITTINIVDT